MSREGQALRATLYTGGVVATAAGADTAIRGARSVPGEGAANAAIESEIRYYSAFYAAFGLAALRLAPRADRDPNAVRAVAATVFGAGLARAAGWRAAGKPHPAQRALLAAEFLVPAVLLGLQRRIGSRT